MSVYGHYSQWFHWSFQTSTKTPRTCIDVLKISQGPSGWEGGGAASKHSDTFADSHDRGRVFLSDYRTQSTRNLEFSWQIEVRQEETWIVKDEAEKKESSRRRWTIQIILQIFMFALLGKNALCISYMLWLKQKKLHRKPNLSQSRTNNTNNTKKIDIPNKQPPDTIIITSK